MLRSYLGGTLHRFLIGILIVLACGLAATAAPAAVPKEEWATFIMVSGPDTLMRERFIRRSTEVEGLIVLGHRLMQGYRMTLGDRAAVASLDMRLSPYPSMPESAQVYITAGRRGDQVQVMTRGVSNRMDSSFAIDADVQLGVAGSIVFLEQLVMHSRALGRKSRTIPVYLPATNKNWKAKIEPIGRDSMRVVMSGDEWRFKVDENGRLWGGETVRSSIKMVRILAAE